MISVTVCVSSLEIVLKPTQFNNKLDNTYKILKEDTGLQGRKVYLI